jgi:hypothetical protein
MDSAHCAKQDMVAEALVSGSSGLFLVIPIPDYSSVSDLKLANPLYKVNGERMISISAMKK